MLQQLHFYELAGFLAFTLGLALLVPRAARTILAAATLLGVCELGRSYLPSHAAAEAFSIDAVLRWLAEFLEGACAIKIAAIAIFQLLLPLARRYPPRILQDVAEGGAYVTWTLILMNANGVDTTGLITTSAILTAVVGLAFQDTLGNLVTGLAIQSDKSIRVGDWIRMDGIDGRISEIRWRYTALETRNWETVLVPNSAIAKNRVIILGRREGEPPLWRRTIWFNVDFRFHPTRVIREIENALVDAEIARVARTPRPQCIFVEFAESYGRYGARYWLNDLEVDEPTDSAVREHIYTALDRAGISLSMPAHAVFLTEDTPERKEEKLAADMSRRKEALRKVEIFKDLNEQELETLAARLVRTPFLAGEHITRQGAEGDWLYMVASGEADVIYEHANGQEERVSGLKAGDFFGEMALVTGEPRSATVIARSEMRCYRLDKESFSEILRARPPLAAKISDVLAARSSQLETTLREMNAEERARGEASKRGDILARIRSLFGI